MLRTSNGLLVKKGPSETLEPGVNIFSTEVKQLTHFIYPTEAVIPKNNPSSGEIFYSLKQTDTLTSRSTYQPVRYIDSDKYELIDFEMNGYAQIHWSQNGELALIYGEDNALNEAAMKMYSFTDGCFELKGMEVESNNPIIKSLTDFPIFQWYLR